jgi:hypothetical protein
MMSDLVRLTVSSTSTLEASWRIIPRAPTINNKGLISFNGVQENADQLAFETRLSKLCLRLIAKHIRKTSISH